MSRWGPPQSVIFDRYEWNSRVEETGKTVSWVESFPRAMSMRRRQIPRNIHWTSRGTLTPPVPCSWFSTRSCANRVRWLNLRRFLRSVLGNRFPVRDGGRIMRGLVREMHKLVCCWWIFIHSRNCVLFCGRLHFIMGGRRYSTNELNSYGMPLVQQGQHNRPCVERDMNERS